jgi:hypothetical protein
MRCLSVILAAALLSGTVCAETHNARAVRLYREGNYSKAEEAARLALAEYLEKQGPDHPHTAITLNNLAAIYVSQSRMEEAEWLYRKALAIRETALGPNHPDTIASKRTLESVVERQGKGPEDERTAYAKPIPRSGSAREGKREVGPSRSESDSSRMTHPISAATPSESTRVALGMIVSAIVLFLMIGLLVALSHHHLGVKQQSGESGLRPSDSSDVGAAAPAASVGITVTAKASERNARQAKAGSRESPSDSASPPSNTLASSPKPTSEAKTDHFKSRKSQSPKGEYAGLLVLFFWLIAFGGCCYVVASRSPYNPNWRKDPRYDNYDYPLSPDDGGYLRVP